MGIPEYIAIITATVAIGVGAIVSSYPKLGAAFIVIGVLCTMAAVYQHSTWVRNTLNLWPTAGTVAAGIVGAILFGAGYHWMVVAPIAPPRDNDPLPVAITPTASRNEPDNVLTTLIVEFPTSGQEAEVAQQTAGTLGTTVTLGAGTGAVSVPDQAALTEESYPVLPFLKVVPLKFDRTFQTKQMVRTAVRNTSKRTPFNIVRRNRVVIQASQPDVADLEEVAIPPLAGESELILGHEMGPLLPEELSKLASGELGYWIYGRIDYSDDTAGLSKHMEQYCYVFRRGELRRCDTGNNSY